MIPEGLTFANYDFAQSGEPHRLGDYEVGEKIEVEAFHNSGDKLDFVGEWLRRPEA